MSVDRYSGSSASVSGASQSDVERRNSSPLTSPPSSHQSPSPAKQSNHTPSSSPPKEQPGNQATLQAPLLLETTSSQNVNAYTTATADDAIDPALKGLSDSFPAGPEGLQVQDPALDDFSWLPDFAPNNQSPAAVSGGANPLWPINTAFNSLPSTQPPSSTSESPSSPLARRGSADWSNGENATDLESLVAGSVEKQGGNAGKITNIRASAASSESGFETGRDDGVPPPKKKSHARKQPEGHIKRARNAFILFRKHITDSNLIPPSVEVKHQNISVVAAKMWKEAPQEVRQEFQEKARLEKEEHQRKYPGYRYQPVFRRTDIIRRRVRKDPAEDDKVDAVADALIKGKAGGDLEKEIKDQLVTRSDASENESEISTKSRSRRRREVGQLSKGAVRAQRAQARAKQMRQNLLGSNLLNMSLYNAANARLASSTGTNDYHARQDAAAAAGMAPPNGAMNGPHGYSHPGMQYAMDSYMQMGYGMDGRPLQMGGSYSGEAYGGIAQGGPAPTGVESEMYRLPPIDGMMGAGNGYEWQAPPGMDYWEQGGVAPDNAPPPQQGYPMEEGYYAPGYEMEGVPAEHNMEYRLPPLMETSREDGRPFAERAPGDLIANAYAHGENESRDLPSMRQWTHDGQQTPSNHVMFSERLFDGALGSAGIPERPEGDDALGMFDQAMEHAGEVAQW
ncbi:hypothetical protein B9479_004962 [Cryptococcus floricola]|uniref:HMG box domain-containing protein n=1 Tax=Cryptococcus floricola TaxID=2591691 RepID=A0A5D3AUQ7_9TREE|nr:hypothetical protein B9479_004962 [Cryptococcus floricola]